MSTIVASSKVIQIPVTRPPFDYVSTPSQATPAANSYFVTIQVSPGYVAPVSTNPASRIHPCQVDTGSCGIVVPQSLFYVNGDIFGPLLPGVTQGAAVTVHYQPSSDDLNGFYYTVERLGVGVDQNGNCACICENVQVIGAYGTGPNQGMMGIGFGRPTELGTNVFLSAPGVNPSFLLTTEGIWLGYTQATLPNAANYGFQPLSVLPPSNTTAQGWQTPAAAITVSGAGAAAAPVTYQGSALLDTGVNLMMIGFPDTTWNNVANPSWMQAFVGRQITVNWPGTGGGSINSSAFTLSGVEAAQLGAGPALTQVFTVAGPSPMNPKYVVPLGQKSPAFVNTGINVIRGANYFFDSTSGVIGFEQTGG